MEVVAARAGAIAVECTRMGPRRVQRGHAPDWLLNGGRSASSTEVVMGRLSTTRTPLRSPMPCYWEQRPVALQRRTALGQWYHARSAAWIDIQKAHATLAAAQAAFPAGKTCRLVEITERQSPAAPDLASRPRSSVGRVWLARNLPRRLGSGLPSSARARSGWSPRSSRPSRVALEVRGGGLEPDGGARQAWIFQRFTSAGIRK
jgi:hypothetical protein